MLRIAVAWVVTLIMVLPIYYWVTVSIKRDKDVFTLPPKLYGSHFC